MVGQRRVVGLSQQRQLRRNAYERKGTTDTDNEARNQRLNRSDRNQQVNRNQDHPMKKVSLDGEVDGFKKVNLKDSNGLSRP